jgi:hypothetical protein
MLDIKDLRSLMVVLAQGTLAGSVFGLGQDGVNGQWCDVEQWFAVTGYMEPQVVRFMMATMRRKMD